jgi:hypothetical protein
VERSVRVRHVPPESPDGDAVEALIPVIANAQALRTFKSLALPFADYVSTDALERAQQLLPSISDASYGGGLLPATYERW